MNCAHAYMSYSRVVVGLVVITDCSKPLLHKPRQRSVASCSCNHVADTRRLVLFASERGRTSHGVDKTADDNRAGKKLSSVRIVAE